MGNAFARLQIKAILATLLRQYEFSSTSDPIGSDFHGLVIGPSQPCRVRYRRRQPQTTRRTAVAAKPSEAVATKPPEAAATKPSGIVASKPSDIVGAKPFRVICDLDLCQSHAACMGEAPEVFRVGRVGKVSLILERPSPELRTKVEAAVKHCPTGTLRIEDLPTRAEASSESSDLEADGPNDPARGTADSGTDS